jgi:hypothetical protein
MWYVYILARVSVLATPPVNNSTRSDAHTAQLCCVFGGAVSTDNGTASFSYCYTLLETTAYSPCSSMCFDLVLDTIATP